MHIMLAYSPVLTILSNYTNYFSLVQIDNLFFFSKHTAKHTKPVKCGITGCQKTCSTRRDLNRHQIAKHPEQFDRIRIPYDIPEYSRFFVRRDHVVRHKKAFYPS